jgi:hypothetical protein
MIWSLLIKVAIFIAGVVTGPKVKEKLDASPKFNALKLKIRGWVRDNVNGNPQA